MDVLELLRDDLAALPVGSRARLEVGLDHLPTEPELAAIQEEVRDYGTAYLREGDEWPVALVVEFGVPEARPGVGFLPVPILLAGVLAGSAVIGILGWRISNTVDNFVASLSEKIVPLTLIVAGALVLWGATRRVA